jgi:hypothetical protein
MLPEPRSVPAWRRLLELLAFVLVSTLVIFILSTIALVTYTKGTANPSHTALVIPNGSATAIAAGDAVLDVPPVWIFTVGDTLSIDNRDSVAYFIGNWSVDAGMELVIEMESPSEGTLLTDLLPAGVVTVNVEPDGFDFSLIAFTTFAFGISIGVIMYIGFSIARAMGRNDDEDWNGA